MTVTLSKSGSTSVVLCHGVQYSGTAGKWVGPLGDSAYSCKWHTLAREFIGATDASPKNLGNRLWEVPLACGMECASESAAWSMYYAWAASLLYDGTALTFGLDDGGSVSYAHAEIQELDMDVHGCYLIARYKFICSSPTVTAPSN